MPQVSIREQILDCLKRFLEATGRSEKPLNDDTNLIRGLGFVSDEGIDFALDLSEELGLDLPHDFNPFVHPTGHRGMRLGELVKLVEGYAATSGGTL
ncbi:hypothetical protein GC197_04725 [bacterium]|nr:hypothetical protein [bacterium]